MMLWKTIFALVTLVLVTSCQLITGSPTSTASPSVTPFPPGLTATPKTHATTPFPSASHTPVLTPLPSGTPRGELPEEAILILEPGPGSQLIDSIHLAGIAGPTFESHLLVQVVLEDGSTMTSLPITIQAEMGSRGPFEVDIPFTVQERRQAFILVSSSSPRDGGTTHLASAGVTLAPEGAVEIRPATSHTERIHITQPILNETLSGSPAHVQGFAMASFEGTLVIDLLDAEGNLLATQPIIVQTAEMGQYGPFEVELPFQVTAPGAGRLVVHDPSVVFQGDVHLASVEVNLAP